jgi:hypothetical protein
MTNDEKLIELKLQLLDKVTQAGGEGLKGVSETLTLVIQEAYELGKEQGWVDDWDLIVGDGLCWEDEDSDSTDFAEYQKEWLDCLAAINRGERDYPAEEALASIKKDDD